MGKFSVSFGLYSPRWGHEDQYTVTFRDDEMRISGVPPKEAICTLRDAGDPEWSGYQASSGNPFLKMLDNDMIYAPAIIPWALEQAWKKWREGNQDDEVEIDRLTEGLADLFD